MIRQVQNNQIGSTPTPFTTNHLVRLPVITSSRKVWGFTLIEVLIYIAMLVLIIGAGMTSAFYLITSSEKDSMAFNTAAEAEFLLRKIDWALTGVETIDHPPPDGSLLKVNKTGFASPVQIRLEPSTGRAQLDTGSGWVDLTGDRVVIINLLFVLTDNTAPALDKIKVTFLANGNPYELTKYLRY